MCVKVWQWWHSHFEWSQKNNRTGCDGTLGLFSRIKASRMSPSPTRGRKGELPQDICSSNRGQSKYFLFKSRTIKIFPIQIENNREKKNLSKLRQSKYFLFKSRTIKIFSLQIEDNQNICYSNQGQSKYLPLKSMTIKRRRQRQIRRINASREGEKGNCR